MSSARTEKCPCCRRTFARLATHLSASSAATCKQYVAELNLDESDEELKSARCNDGELGEQLEELLQDDAARQVANALAHLRYERGLYPSRVHSHSLVMVRLDIYDWSYMGLPL